MPLNALATHQRQRFWQSMQRCVHGPGCPVCCWEWQKARHNQGYGRILRHIDGIRYSYAHRLAWYLTTGQHPTQQICHTCDNPPCCNPQHLWEGSMKDNQQDCVRKGRKRGGTIRTLTPTQVQDIRRRWAEGESQRQIARDYPVSQVTICHILTGKTWRTEA